MERDEDQIMHEMQSSLLSDKQNGLKDGQSQIETSAARRDPKRERLI